MLVLVKEYGVYGIVLAKYLSGARKVQWFDAGFSYIMTLEEDEYIDYTDLWEEEKWMM